VKVFLKILSGIEFIFSDSQKQPQIYNAFNVITKKQRIILTFSSNIIIFEDLIPYIL